nr:uncharacterized protein LOC108019045 [Drosophila suzukii]
MAEETNYKLSEHNLDIPADLAFVDGLLQDHGLEAEPQTRGFILDLAYTLARDKLVEAQHFAQLANRSTVSVEDLQMAKLRRTRKLRRSEKLSACSMKLMAKQFSQEYLPEPRAEVGLMLPYWYNCQVDVMAKLKGKIIQFPKRRIGRPPKSVAPAATSAADTSPTSAAAIFSTADADTSSTSEDETSFTSAAATSFTSAAASSSTSTAAKSSTSDAATSSASAADTSSTSAAATSSTSAAAIPPISNAVTAFTSAAVFSTFKFRSRSRTWTGP